MSPNFTYWRFQVNVIDLFSVFIMNPRIQDIRYKMGIQFVSIKSESYKLVYIFSLLGDRMYIHFWVTMKIKKEKKNHVFSAFSWVLVRWILRGPLKSCKSEDIISNEEKPATDIFKDDDGFFLIECTGFIYSTQNGLVQIKLTLLRIREGLYEHDQYHWTLYYLLIFKDVLSILLWF